LPPKAIAEIRMFESTTIRGTTAIGSGRREGATVAHLVEGRLEFFLGPDACPLDRGRADRAEPLPARLSFLLVVEVACEGSPSDLGFRELLPLRVPLQPLGERRR
jgi:hypothetical protein